MPSKRLLLFPIFISFFLIASLNAQADIVINEYSCSNMSQVADDYGDYGDWIELYNTGGASVDISGYYLSDNPADPTMWQVPAGVTITANGFKRFWASGRNVSAGVNYHTNFKLTQSKNNPDFVVLANSSGNIIDYAQLTRTMMGHSFGRIANGSATWGVFTTPTSSTSNTTASYTAYAAKPDASMPAGYYTSSFTVSLYTSEPNSVIRFTTDGTEPTGTSALYSSPITIAATTVLKAITISSDPTILPSFMVYNTYFMNVSHTLKVVSISGTSLTTLANGSGGLVPFGSVEYFDTTRVRTSKSYGTFNRHGQDSWANDQRSIDFIARDEMGYSDALHEKMFPYSDRDQFQRFIMRAAGDDNYPAAHHSQNAGSAHLRDSYVQMLAKRGGLDLDVRGADKCIVYINGQYWGVYDLRERCDDHDFTNYYYGQSKYEIQYVERWGNRWAEYGGNQAMSDWDTFYNWTMSHNMTNAADYATVTSQLDVQSLADYIIVNALVNTTDWLNYNTGWWRGLNPNGGHKKWGYILWDNDAVFAFYINYTGIPDTSRYAPLCQVETGGLSDPDGHLDLLAHLRQNPDFNHFYISRYADLMNTAFSCDEMLGQLDAWKAMIDPEMTQHANRWFGTYTEWQTNFNRLRNFVAARCSLVATTMNGCYNTTGPYPLTLDADPANAGKVSMNSMTIDHFPWSGFYFGGISVNMRAIVTDTVNFQFDHWTSNNTTYLPSSMAINPQVNLTTGDTLVVHFTQTPTGILPPAVKSEKPYITVFPNVISSEATIEYYLPFNVTPVIKIYSLLGEEVMQIKSEGRQQQGLYQIKLNAQQSALPPGMYMVQLTAGDFQKSVKVFLEK
ncbi:MAG: CotH kinase family protein [Bacteroidetes bacterium]|nr:CotH kinase family protein [Bacteroidota bacterium]